MSTPGKRPTSVVAWASVGSFVLSYLMFAVLVAQARLDELIALGACGVWLLGMVLAAVAFFMPTGRKVVPMVSLGCGCLPVVGVGMFTLLMASTGWL